MNLIHKFYQHGRIHTLELEDAVESLPKIISLPVEISYGGRTFVATPCAPGECGEVFELVPVAHVGISIL